VFPFDAPILKMLHAVATVNGRFRVTHSSGRLNRGLLVIVGAEAIYCTEIARLRRRGYSTGRLSVDGDVTIHR